MRRRCRVRCARNQLTSSTAGSATTNYSYTARGTLATVTGTSTETLTYDAFDQLVTDGTTNYTHDAFGRLATAGSATFTYNGTDNTIVSDGTDTYSRGLGNQLIGISNSAGASLAYTDQHGDLSATFTATGTALAGSTAYAPYGQVIASSGTRHDLGYQGGWTDPTTSRTATASRWYDPATGNFTSHDATSQPPAPSVNANPYTYGNDNPLTNADPSGNSSCYSAPYSPAPEPSSNWQPAGDGGGGDTGGGGGGGGGYTAPHDVTSTYDATQGDDIWNTLEVVGLASLSA